MDWLLKKLDRSGDCWLWTGWTDRDGYGYSDRGAVHRIAYEGWVGPIGSGLTLDHLCRVKTCCNPDHLEPVTRAENDRRKREALGIGEYAQSCQKGHPRTPESTAVRTRGNGSTFQRCRVCEAENSRNYAERKKVMR